MSELRAPVHWTTDVGAVYAAARAVQLDAAIAPAPVGGNDGVRVLVHAAGVAVFAWPTGDPDETWEAHLWALSRRNEDTAASALALEVMMVERAEPDVVMFMRRPMMGEQRPRPAWSTFDTAWQQQAFDYESGRDGPEITIPAAYVLDEIVDAAFAERARIARGRIREKYPTLKVLSAGGAMPFQAEGYVEGWSFYFRYRHGHVSLSFAAHDPVGEPYWWASKEHGDSMGGILDEDEFADLFLELMELLVQAPFLYRFNVLNPDGSQVTEERYGSPGLDRPLEIAAWGHDPMSAEQAALDQLAMFRPNLRDVVVASANEDPREFPQVDPQFLPTTPPPVLQ